MYEPAERVVQLAVSLDWERNLVVRTTDTAAFDFEVRADILECLFKDFKRVFAVDFLGSTFKRVVDGTFGNKLLAVKHALVDQTLHHDALVFAVRLEFAL